MNFRTIIVEDEPLSLFFLKNLLAEHCPEVTVLATTGTEDEAVKCIMELRPDLVLMDIDLQQGNGFAVLQRTRNISYDVIFTTALDYTGIRAIQFSGVDYLQKPIDIDGLIAVINKMATDCTERNIAKEQLLATLDNNNEPLTLVISAFSGKRHINLSELVLIKKEASGCVFVCHTESIKAEGLQIKDYEMLPGESGFFRPHLDYLIRLQNVTATSRPGEGVIIMTNKMEVPVSPKKAEQLAVLLYNYA